MPTKSKYLIIRFSSFGDVTQALSIPSKIQFHDPQAEIHWMTRQDLSPLLEGHPSLHKIWKLNKFAGLSGLLQLAKELRAQNYTHIYDAHNNLRSHIVSWILRWGRSIIFLRKSQKRWKRFLLFYAHINTYQMPFSGQRDLLEPLLKWGMTIDLPPAPQLFLNAALVEKTVSTLPPTFSDSSGYVALAPSAAYPLKRWPLLFWKELIQKNPQHQFVVLGGPEDLFLKELEVSFPQQVLNLAGRCSILESAALIKKAKALVSNDTGLLHVAEQQGIPAIALMGPAPFGFPSRPSTHILELDLPCRPCSKHGQGPCRNSQYQLCLTGISPQLVSTTLQEVLK